MWVVSFFSSSTAGKPSSATKDDKGKSCEDVVEIQFKTCFGTLIIWQQWHHVIGNRPDFGPDLIHYIIIFSAVYYSNYF